MTASLIMKLMIFLHGYKATRATQDLFFKRNVEVVRGDDRGLLAQRQAEFTQLLHVVEFSGKHRKRVAAVVRRCGGGRQRQILACQSVVCLYPVFRHWSVILDRVDDCHSPFPDHASLFDARLDGSC